MNKKGCWLTLLFLLLISIRADLFGAVAKLKPHNVIVQSSFKEEIRIPVLKHHNYTIFEPGTVQEPYQPEFNFSITHLPDNLAQNATISWLTKFSPSLARIFKGNSGRFENGLFFYQQNRLNKAEQDLITLLNQTSAYRDRAVLYLAWIKYKDQLWEEAIKLSSYLYHAANIELVKEAHYLTSLIYLKQNKYGEVLDLNEALQVRLPLDQFELKQIYVHLICQINLGFWNDAKNLSDALLTKPIAHSKLFHKIRELSGLIDYKNKDYRSSIKKYRLVKTYNAHPEFQFTTNRHIAWLYYLTGNYKSAIDVLQDPKSQYLSDYTEELTYLKLACFVRLKKWNRVSVILDYFNDGSLFHTYGSFLVRQYLSDPSMHPELFRLVSTQKFNFPEMKFHVALLDGNLFFRQKKFYKAKDAFIRAMSVDSSSSDYWISQYNLGLTHLKLGQYKSAEQDFLNLMRTVHSAPTDQLQYQLIYAQYQQSISDPAWASLEPENFPSLNKEQQIEILFIKAGTLLKLGKRENAKSVFAKIWQQTKRQEALEFIVKIQYDQRQFSKVIKLIGDVPQYRSDILIVYEVKSLLALRHFKEAKKAIEKIHDSRDPFIALRLEVWVANNEYKSIIKYVSKLLRQSLDKEQRRYYYLSLGDAFFNLQQYQESKSQYYRALGLTREHTLKSLILYNIALSSYYHNDYTSFLSEVKLILKKQETTEEVRFNLTNLLTEFYQNSDRLVQADKILEQYSQSNSYNRASIHIKRIRIWFQNDNHKQCVKLSRTGVSDENEYQRRDRLIMFGYCANSIHLPTETIKAIQLELKNHPNLYRINELNFVLAQAYSQAKNFKRSLQLAQFLTIKPLNTKVRLDTQLLITQNLLKLNKLKKAYEELGDVNQYRVSGHYVRSLQLKGEIELQEKKHHQAYRTLLRIYYLSGVSIKAQQFALLRIAEGYISEKKFMAAKRHFNKIDPKIISKELAAQRRYEAVRSAISGKHTQSDVEQFDTEIEELFHVKQFLYFYPSRAQTVESLAIFKLSHSDHGA